MGDRDLTLTICFFSSRAKFYYVNRKLEGTSKAVEPISPEKGEEFNITPTQFQHSEYPTSPKAIRKMTEHSEGIPSFFQFPELATHLF